MKAHIAGVAIIGAGFDDWDSARAVLSGVEPWEERETPIPKPALLSPNERRRTSPVVRLALSAAEAACANAGLPPDVPDCIFTSALGDGKVTHALLNALSRPEKAVSPTHFHNSVHNATAGYWSMGVGNYAASTSLAAGNGSFGAGLLKVLLTVSAETRPVLLVAVEHPMPEPLNVVRPVGPPLAVGLVLVPPTSAGGPTVTLKQGNVPAAATPPRTSALRPLWQTSPPARALPILEGLIEPAEVIVDAGEDFNLQLSVTP